MINAFHFFWFNKRFPIFLQLRLFFFLLFTSSFLSKVHVPSHLAPSHQHCACVFFLDSRRTEVLLLHLPDWSGGFHGTSNSSLMIHSVQFSELLLFTLLLSLLPIFSFALVDGRERSCKSIVGRDDDLRFVAVAESVIMTVGYEFLYLLHVSLNQVIFL